MASNIILYTNSECSSPYVLSVYATLVEKGLPFEIKSIDLATGENLAPEYRRISLTSAIIEYLEETFAPPGFPSVFPTDPQQRARARQIQAWVRSDLGALREERQTTVIYDKRNPQPLSEAGRRAADKLLAVADTLIDAQGGDLFGSWSIADVDFSVMLNRLHANGDPVPEKIRRYVDRQSERGCVKSWWALARR
jgi:glutathione S-transferase